MRCFHPLQLLVFPLSFQSIYLINENIQAMVIIMLIIK